MKKKKKKKKKKDEEEEEDDDDDDDDEEEAEGRNGFAMATNESFLAFCVSFSSFFLVLPSYFVCT